jgi:diketogulonate reductase-like aldo/keto reductase
LSNAERSDSIKGIAATLSTTKMLEKSGTPQNRAFNWLTKQDSLFVCPDDVQSVQQRYILAVVYFALDGDDWDKCSRTNNACTTMVGGKLRSFASYLSSDDVCKWFGVSCDGSGAITHVLLG